MIFSLARVFLPLLALLAIVSAAPTQKKHHHPTVYLLRHGEKPPQKNNHHLNSDGYKRAECLRSVFAADSPYDIGYILAPQVKWDGSHGRAFDTVLPLAKDLGLQVDTSCKSKEPHCVATHIKHYHKKENALISWRHGKMQDIARELGIENPPEYPNERYDVVWTIPYPYNKITGIWSEECPGLDYDVGSSFLKVQG